MEAIFFDFDGVIIDSEPVMRIAFAEAYRIHYGEDSECPIEEYLKHTGHSFPRIMQKMGLTTELFEDFRRVSINNMDKIKLFPGIIDVIINCKKNDQKLALITGKDSARTIQILKKFELYQYFDLLICSDMVKNPKPNPESIYRALNYFNIKSNQAIMIGDSLYDIVCAQRASVSTIAVLWGVEKNQSLFEGIGADHIVQVPNELLKLIA